MIEMTHRPASRLLLIALLLGLIVAGCGAAPQSETAAQSTAAIATATPAPSATAPPVILPTITSAGQATLSPAEPVELALWWPEPLAPLDDEDAADLLSEQISAFQTTNRDLMVDFRLKRAQEVGGIMSTLRTASAVAPGALPDVTLLRRADLLAAAQAGLIYPLDEAVSAALLDDMHASAVELGRVENQLFGLPYALEVQHIAYDPDRYPGEGWSYDAVLEQGKSFVFAAGRANTLSDVFLVQYLSAGGSLSDTGVLIAEEEVLRRQFRFYEQAVNAGLLDPIVLEYTHSTNYQQELAQGSLGAGVVTSTIYLNLIENDAPTAFDSIPTDSGRPTTVLDGWMWVFTSADPDRQALALRFLNWMMDVERQGEYNHAVNMLPSQRTALRQQEDPVYADFVDRLLEGAVLPLGETSGSTTARVIQTALASVISGQRTAAEAAQDVVSQLGA